jgi:hypothetical protein
LHGQRRKFHAVLGDPSVQRIVVEHRDHSADSDLSTFRPRSRCRDESWSWWIRLRLMTTWCGT